MSRNKKSGIVVSVLNMKGGVGKTTISAHVMRVLYHRHSLKVLLVDLDPQFNLTQCLLTRSRYDTIKASNKTVFAIMEPPSKVGLFEVATSNHTPPKASEIAHTLKRFADDSAYLHLIPGNFDLVKYSLITDRTKLDFVTKRFLRFIADAKAHYDLIVLDCNPSSSHLTMCALRASSRILVPVKPDKYSILGLELVADFLERIPEIELKPEITVLLNGIPRSHYDDTVETQLRAHATFGKNVLARKLRNSKLLAADSNYSGFATDRPVAYKDLLKTEIADISDELKTAWGF